MVNGLSLEAGLEAWLGQMTSDGLSPGTVSTYLQTVMNLCPILHRSTEARRICAAAEAFHTHRGGRGHAVDMTPTEAQSIIKKAMKSHPEKAAELWMLLVTGARASCIDRLCGDSVHLTPAFLTLRIRFSKGVRKSRKRRQIRYPLKGLPAPPAMLRNLLKSRNSKKGHILAAKAGSLNKILAETCQALRTKRVTTGTFRRVFAQRIQPYCKENQIALSEMMVHTSDDMHKAYYTFDV